MHKSILGDEPELTLTFIRPHYFVEKKVVVKEVCGVCHARIGFRRVHYKCRDCGISSHIECRYFQH